ncbi:hypothetical protein BDZ91DRAFT_649227 [Kalaharituber pfeilii]|nr:hypothetical protein BDZ91DRAFT_649227 [Kalaharituber pfeilii]
MESSHYVTANGNEGKRKRQRVAIVGSGLAGLTTAYLLNKAHFDVEIFEMGTKPSLDAASLSVNYTINGRLATERIDVPMRAFAGGYYKNLLAMYRHLGIPFRAQKFLFTFSTTEYNGGEALYFIHSSNNHRFPPIKPEGRSTVEFIYEALYLWIVYNYFTFCCFMFPPERRRFSPSSATTMGKTESLREYLARIYLPQYFVTNYLLPLMSSVTTCPHETLLDFPASDVTGYKKHMHKQPHYMVEGGVCQIQEKLLEGIPIGMGRKVTKVERIPAKQSNIGYVLVQWEEKDPKDPGMWIKKEKRFDQAVLAVNPYVVGRIYRRLGKQMESIPCCEAEVVVHYDERVMEGVMDPSGVVADAASKGARVPSLVTESTHIHPPGVLLTTSTIYPLDQRKVIGASRFVRVLRTPESRDTVECIFRPRESSGEEGEWRNGDEGVWLVGGWCWDGMVLLEGCVRSAGRVARELGVEVPWEKGELVREESWE